MKPGLKILFVLIIYASTIAYAFIVLPGVAVNGIGLTPDSVTYIATAKSMLVGNGFSVGADPMTHYPPVYPLLLAGSGFFGQDLMESTLWLHTILYGANAIIFMLCIYFGTRYNLLAMVTGGLLYFSSASVLYVHAYALSESPFIFFTLLAFLLMALYSSSEKWTFLFFTSIALGLGIATRYVGIALLPPFLISLFLFNRKSFRQKFLALLWFTTLAILPLTVWLIRNLKLTQSAANRTFVFHPIDINRIKSMINTFHNFIFPAFENRWINAVELSMVLLIIIFILFHLFKIRSAFTSNDLSCRVFIALGIIFTVSYILVLVLSISFFDAGTSLDERILLPAYLAMTISVFAIVDLFSNTIQKPTVLIVFLFCMAFVIRFNLLALTERANQMHGEGMGYNAVFWNNSPTIDKVTKLPADAVIYSNGFDVIRIKTGRDTLHLPRKFDSASTLQNPDFTLEMDAMCDEVDAGKAFIVYLVQVNWREYFADERELIEACNAPLLIDTPDGVIFGTTD